MSTETLIIKDKEYQIADFSPRGRDNAVNLNLKRDHQDYSAIIKVDITDIVILFDRNENQLYEGSQFEHIWK